MSPSPVHVIRLASAAIKRLYAVTGFSASSYLQTDVGGGEPGLASGFGVAVVARLRGPVGSLMSLVNRIAPNASAPTSGWLEAAGVGTFIGARNFGVVNGSGTVYYGGTSTVMPSDIGRLQTLVLQFTGSAVWVIYDREISTFTPVAVTGYTPSTGRMMLGNDPGVASGASAWEVLDFASWAGTPTNAQLLAFFDSVRTNNKTPTTIGGVALRHRHNASETYNALSLQTGDTAAALTDTITSAAADALAPVGTPTVQVITTKTDGLVTYGLTGFSWLSHYATTTAGAFTGTAAGFYVGGIHTLGGTTLSGTQMLAHCLDDAATRGWYVHISNGALRFVAYNTSGAATVASTYTCTAADQHWPLWWAAQLTSSGTMRLFVRGVQAGADVALSGTYGPASSTSLRIGVYRSSSPQPLDGTFWGLAAGADATVAEIKQAYADYQSTGVMQGVTGKIGRLYQPTTDAGAAGGRFAAPDIVDRAGSGFALARVGGVTVDATNGSGLRGMDGANTLYISRGSAIASLTVNLYIEALVYVRSAPTYYAKICGTNETSSSGWTFGVSNGGFYISVGSATGTKGTNYPTLTMDALHHLAFTIDGTGYVNLYLDGVSAIGGTGLTFTPDPTGEFKIFGVEPTTVLGVAAAFPTLPTAAEIQASATAALSAKKLAGISGKTVRRWSPPDDVLVDGQRSPAGLRERTSGLDAMQQLTPPPQVAQRTDKLWTYDSAPLMYGVRGFTDANYYNSGAGLMPGSTGGFWVTMVLSFEAFTNGTSGIVLTGGNWSFYTASANTQIYFSNIGSDSTFRGSPLATLTTREIGKPAVVTGVYDAVAQKIRIYYRRTEVSTGTATVGYTASGGAIVLGRGYSTGNPSPDTTVYGFAYGHGIPSAAQVAAQHDNIIATDGRLQIIPGLTAHVFDFYLDGIAGSGTLGTTITNRFGSGNLTRVGSPTTFARYARTFCV